MSDSAHKLNTSGTVAVATDYYWIPCDERTPRGVKLQLLTKGGVAIYGIYKGEDDFTDWAPLPRRREQG